MAKDEPPKPPKTKPFRPERLAKGVFAGMVSTCLVHPLDVLKLRQQISTRQCTSWQFASQIYKCEGWKAFYAGMTAGLLRQTTYTASRLAMYDFLYDLYAGQYKQKPIRRDKVAIATLAGLVGGFVGNPSEVVLVRRMAGGTPAVLQARPCSYVYYHVEKYGGTIDALKRIIREEGYKGLWRGATLTMIRSVVVSVGQVGMIGCITKEAKNYQKNPMLRELLKKNEVSKNKWVLSLVSSLMTTFVIAAISHPIDMMKSLYQSSTETGPVKSIYNRIMLCKGAKGLWKGFTPYFLRLSIQTITTFLILEEIKRRANSKKKDEKDGEKKQDTVKSLN